MFAFPFQKAVIATSCFFGEIAANCRAMFIYAAVSLFLIEEDAHAFVDVIFAMSQHARLVILLVLAEFLFSLFVRQAEPFGQSLYVAFVNPDPVVRTTVTGTFGTVVFQFRFFRCLGAVRLQNGQFFFRHNYED